MLGVFAMLIGFVAAGAGTWIGYAYDGMLVTLPAGLPAQDAQTMSIYMIASGVFTMLLGVLSIYRSNEI